MKCRFCTTPLEDVFLDLGSAPASNAYLEAASLNAAEMWLPLKLFTCRQCRLVQVDEIQKASELFAPDYAYYSSVSSSWLAHARQYVEFALPRLGLGPASQVVEIASNDGYLLQYVAAAGVPCLGIEPTAGTAAVATQRGLETLVEFFGHRLGETLARNRRPADLVIANNVLAHVPDLNDFVAGIAALLAPEGVVTVEFPHLMQLVGQNQFDTVYHEHFSYFSLGTVALVFEAHGLRIWDVEPLATHGGSLRVWACRATAGHQETSAVAAVRDSEMHAGMHRPDFYQGFQARADQVKYELLRFLINQRQAGRRVVAYGAAAKGNTLLNYAGVRGDLLPYVVDASIHKQGKFLPGSRIPIVREQRLRDDRPDVVLLLPWNLRDEITSQLAYIRDWGGLFATAVPTMEVW